MLAGRWRDAAVERHGHLHQHERAAVLAPAGETLVEAARLGLFDAYGGFNACGAQGFHSVAGDGGVGVDGGGYYAANTGGDQGLGAWAGSTGVVAGLEGDVGSAAEKAVAGVLFSDFEGGDFSVVDEVVFVPALARDLAGAVENDAADGGVGRGEGDAPTGQFQGSLHPIAVLIQGAHSIPVTNRQTLPERTRAGRSSVRRRRRSGPGG